MSNGHMKLKISLSKERAVMLRRMADEAGVFPGALARSMIEAILDDDDKAHRKAAETARGKI